MNSSSDVNHSGSSPFCLLGSVGYSSSLNTCLLEVGVILFLTVLIIAGNCHFIQTMAYADLLVGVSCLVPSLSLLRRCIVLIWIYSALVFLPSFFGWGKPGYHGDIFQWCAESWKTRPGFSTFIVALLYAPAALTVCFTYGSIFRICRQHTRGDHPAPRPLQLADGGRSKRAQRRAVRGLPGPALRHGAVPHHQRLLRAVDAVHPLLPAESAGLYHHEVASFLTTWLAISNSFCNCLIYSLSNSVFRKGLGRLFRPLLPSCSTCSTCTEAEKLNCNIDNK
uniref:G protein-coupled receptor 21 n=1 Tax=Salarias fasciatus TaxID=181472 RepID=A0A672FIQ0_SALFA